MAAMRRLIVAGFGDIARRTLPLVGGRFEAVALSRSTGADLDRPETLKLKPADAVFHLCPPPPRGTDDPRTANLLRALDAAGAPPRRFVYVSTSGVYGDCGGARVDESRPLAPGSDRARRRVDAEAQLAQWCVARSVALVVLRAPGIYAADRLPLERLRAGVPVLVDEDDVYTNHIHADDLARAVARAVEEDAPQGVYNASDDSELRMAQWMDLVADYAGLDRPPRVSRRAAGSQVPPALMSFMGESRRLVNRRLKERLGVRLCFPTVQQGLSHASAIGAH